MKKAEKNNFYTKNYGKQLKKKFNFMQPAESFIQIYKMFIDKKKKLNCLDYGVGDGRHTEFLINQNHKVVATDISIEAINLTKKRIPKFKALHIINSKNSLQDLGIKKIDLIICWETVHWIGSYEKILDLIKNFNIILKKNGKLIITFPAEDHYLLKKKDIVKKFTYKSKFKERKNMILCAPPLNKLKNIFFKENFSIQAIYKYSRGRIVYNSNRVSLNSTDIKKNLFSMYGFVLKKR
jgi:2-polyprenyl-3-methyl-5-hydroxy-6-metoxy-1,4-benzoquinol methylase